MYMEVIHYVQVHGVIFEKEPLWFPVLTDPGRLVLVTTVPKMSPITIQPFSYNLIKERKRKETSLEKNVEGDVSEK